MSLNVRSTLTYPKVKLSLEKVNVFGYIQLIFPAVYFEIMVENII